MLLQRLDHWTREECLMKTIMRNLTGVLLVAAAALGTAGPQSATQELRLSDIKAQQPREAIIASAPCQRAREAPRGRIDQAYVIDPRSLVQDLNTLMGMSDEVILAGSLDSAAVISPSGESTATYEEVRVIRSWKGPHHAGDTLTFGIPIGEVSCEPTGRFDGSVFSVLLYNSGFTIPGPWIYVLFLRQSKDSETKMVQGLRLTAGEGMQGAFAIQVPGPTYGSEPEMDCAGVQHWSWQRCDAYVKTSQSPVMDPCPRDPLAKKYVRMPASDFLKEMQSVAAGQGSAEKSSSK
jgi:hypothetical protein